jgi:transcriptional regulator GlxA family with amidase domain
MYQTVDYEPIQIVQDWIVDHLEEELTVEKLAEKASMSPRNFARVFLKETGITPAKYVEKVRLETARRRLEETRLSIDEISEECGVGNADRLRRLFIRHLRTTPAEYRKNFSTALTVA